MELPTPTDLTSTSSKDTPRPLLVYTEGAIEYGNYDVIVYCRDPPATDYFKGGTISSTYSYNSLAGRPQLAVTLWHVSRAYGHLQFDNAVRDLEDLTHDEIQSDDHGGRWAVSERRIIAVDFDTADNAEERRTYLRGPHQAHYLGCMYRFSSAIRRLIPNVQVHIVSSDGRETGIRHQHRKEPIPRASSLLQISPEMCEREEMFEQTQQWLLEMFDRAPAHRVRPRLPNVVDTDCSREIGGHGVDKRKQNRQRFSCGDSDVGGSTAVRLPVLGLVSGRVVPARCLRPSSAKGRSHESQKCLRQGGARGAPPVRR